MMLSAARPFRLRKADDFAQIIVVEGAEAIERGGGCRGVQGPYEALLRAGVSLPDYDVAEHLITQPGLPIPRDVLPCISMLMGHTFNMEHYLMGELNTRGFTLDDIGLSAARRVRMSPTGSLDVDVPLFHPQYSHPDMLRVSVITQSDFSVGPSDNAFRLSEGSLPGYEEPTRVGLGYTNETKVPPRWKKHHYILHLSICKYYD